MVALFPSTGAMPMITPASALRTCWLASLASSWGGGGRNGDDG